eukprot:2511976-Rhodomonas_salina.6
MAVCICRFGDVLTMATYIDVSTVECDLPSRETTGVHQCQCANSSAISRISVQCVPEMRTGFGMNLICGAEIGHAFALRSLAPMLAILACPVRVGITMNGIDFSYWPYYFYYYRYHRPYALTQFCQY